MGSIHYYGSDTIDNLPSTIPLVDKAASITGTRTYWGDVTFEGEVNIKKVPTIAQYNIFPEGIEVTNTLYAKNDVLVNGDLYVNSAADLESFNRDKEYYKKVYGATEASATYYTPSTAANVQHGGGNIFAGRITGTTYAALYRDLGERFEIDKPTLKGSIVTLGGEKEITEASINDKFFGVIATEPALRMNEKAGSDETHPYICWCGRVPCRVKGKVKKFDRIYLSDTPGVGVVHNTGKKKLVGIALENKDTEEEGLVEIVTKANIID